METFARREEETWHETKIHITSILQKRKKMRMNTILFVFREEKRKGN